MIVINIKFLTVLDTPIEYFFRQLYKVQASPGGYMKFMNNSCRLTANKSWVLSLALASLLTSGLDVVSKNTAIASPTPEPIQLSQRFQNRLPRRIAIAIIRDASQRSGVAIRQINIAQATRKTFGNPCIFNFGEVCTREYRPIEGWEVILRVRNQSWKYHANQSGSRILLDPQVSVEGNNLPKAIANDVLNDASRRSRIPRRELEITTAKARTFSNSCVFEFGEICTKEYRPVEGWEVAVRVRNRSWTYHVNQTGSRIILDPKAIIEGNNTLPRAIASNILDDAARRFGVSQPAVQITSVNRQVFGNSCVFDFGEICTEEYRPIEGWEVVVRVRNQSWTYHVNQTGSRIVLDPKAMNEGNNTLPRAIASNILDDAIRRSGLSLRQLEITKATPKTFGNACELEFGEICTREYRPIQGWEVIVRVRNQFWTYHIDQTGSQIILDPRVET
ncbi:hypothetical protein Nos7524_4558 [Nostoc sp. PCC 7524]|uniref:hypothetical protein n=1 Tax=Nostoc sp. (strain ATCC 29411 / PCC 7524) TaxID=28072 RepID=UPI00029F31C1|nr:hypothetical protein [Nostoc sp. PCC 7524]AFY50306.1 hypothetical protein Nos7524_4558 [Nostoc sp. PCC 7524]